MSRRGRWLTLGIWMVGLALLAWALRQVSWPELWRLLRGLSPAALAALIALNLVILLALTRRWQIFVQALAHPVGLLPLLRFRIAAFAVSYFTPGPQFGGEPLQVIGLRRHAIPTATATATVALDKLVELITNFTVLALGAAALWGVGLGDARSRTGVSLLALLLFALPLIYLGALWRGRRPLGRLFRWLAARRPAGRLQRGLAMLAESEQLAGKAASEKPGALLRALLWAGAAWALMLLEFGLSARFLGAPLTPIAALAALAAARFAFLLPMPGGLGALAASQVLVFAALGYDPTTAMALALYIRVRDLLIGLAGLALAGRMFRSSKK